MGYDKILKVLICTSLVTMDDEHFFEIYPSHFSLEDSVIFKVHYLNELSLVCLPVCYLIVLTL